MVIKLAWRNIWRNRTRSLVIMLSVSVGLFSGIAVNALYKGMMDSRVRTVIQTETGHLQVHDPEFTEEKDPSAFILGKASLFEELNTMPAVAAFAERTVSAGMLTTATGSAGVIITGIMPGKEAAVSGLDKKIIAGVMSWPENKKGVLMGKKLANKLKLKTGSKIVLTTVDTASSLIAGAFSIMGIFQSANAPLDEVTVYTNINDLRAMLGLSDEIHEVAILLKSDSALETTQKILASSNQHLAVEPWQSLSPETDLMAGTINTYSSIILVIIMIALSFGIMNTMMMSILERKHETGMMMALGMSKNILLQLILLETCLLALGGIPVAIAVAWLATTYFGKNGIDFSGMGQEMMQSFGFETAIYPSFPAAAIPGILLIVMATALVSSLLPIWKSLQMNPIDALQN